MLLLTYFMLLAVLFLIITTISSPISFVCGIAFSIGAIASVILALDAET